MKKNLIRTILKDRTPEWHEFRRNSIGASEVGAVMGQSPYQWSGGVFYDKIGLYPIDFKGNKHTYYGIVMEDVIAKTWEYYDPSDPQKLYENFNTNTKVRYCKNFNGYLQNPKFMHLSASLDRVICKGSFNIITGEELQEDCPLELKTIQVYVLKQYVSEVPIMYILQAMQQMMVSETKYAEVAMLDSDKEFHVYPIEYRQPIAEAILERTKIFWDKVLEGRELMKELAFASEQKREFILTEIEALCPEPTLDEQHLYQEFLNKKYNKSNDTKIVGEITDFQNALKYKYLDKLKKRIDYHIAKYKNALMSKMKNNEKLYFEDKDDMITWRTDKNGSKRFTVSVNLDQEHAYDISNNTINDFLDRI